MMINENDKKAIKSIYLAQDRRAYDVAKFLRTISSRKVSYIIGKRVIISDSNIKIVTELKELPEIRVGHSLSDTVEEFISDVDIDNIED